MQNTVCSYSLLCKLVCLLKKICPSSTYLPLARGCESVPGLWILTCVTKALTTYIYRATACSSDQAHLCLPYSKASINLEGKGIMQVHKNWRSDCLLLKLCCLVFLFCLRLGMGWKIKTFKWSTFQNASQICSGLVSSVLVVSSWSILANNSFKILAIMFELELAGSLQMWGKSVQATAGAYSTVRLEWQLTASVFEAHLKHSPNRFL